MMRSTFSPASCGSFGGLHGEAEAVRGRHRDGVSLNGGVDAGQDRARILRGGGDDDAVDAGAHDVRRDLRVDAIFRDGRGREVIRIKPAHVRVEPAGDDVHLPGCRIELKVDTVTLERGNIVGEEAGGNCDCALCLNAGADPA